MAQAWRRAAGNSMSRLRITGEIEEAADFSAEELAAFGVQERIEDVRSLGAAREGGGVYLHALLGRVRPRPHVRYITLVSPSDDFSVSVPIDRVADIGVVIYEIEGKPIPPDRGGPFRFIIPDSAACHTDEIDDCANVKFLEEISLSAERGRDTRPRDEAEHARLHAGTG